jgi:hypothetical protein
MADDGLQPYIDSQMEKIQMILKETREHLEGVATQPAPVQKIASQWNFFEHQEEDYKPITPIVVNDAAHQKRIAFVKTLETNVATAKTIGPHGFQSVSRNYWLLWGLAMLLFLLLGAFAIVVIFTALKLTH